MSTIILNTQDPASGSPRLHESQLELATLHVLFRPKPEPHPGCPLRRPPWLLHPRFQVSESDPSDMTAPTPTHTPALPGFSLGMEGNFRLLFLGRPPSPGCVRCPDPEDVARYSGHFSPVTWWGSCTINLCPLRKHWRN